MDTKGGNVMEFDLLSKKVIGAALKVHSALGPGLFLRRSIKSAYAMNF
jgi:hypothetical protein